ncbi:MAG TPA: DUF92 domain-containing protein [Anaerolineaceae bacterium]
MIHPLQLVIGLALALIVSFAAYRAHALNRSGAAAAALLGTVVFGLGGLTWAVLLLAFFISSSGLSRLFKRRKAGLDEKFSKSSRRDAGQVLANGGFSGLFVLLHLVFPDALWPWLGFAGSLAAANADTWATELGVLSLAQPRMITTGKAVERGTSGAISITGTLAALSGSLLIGLLAGLLWRWNAAQTLPPEWFAVWAVIGWVTLAGLAGSLIDSLLGATLQAIYTCPTCRKETERHPLHLCGTPTQYLRGLAWMDNDWVNGLCTLAGGVLAALGVLLKIA